MGDKVLSVSIAAYNIASTLQEVLAPFLLENVIDRVDVMIVDDGSKDETANIAQEYQERYPDTFRLIRKENGGWGSTLNVGMRAARGKYFKQLDGDDFFSYENLCSFLDYLEKANSDIVHTPFVTYSDASGGVLNVLNDFGWQNYDIYPKETTLRLDECPKIRPEMHNFAVLTKILQENEIFITEHCFYTDVEYSLKAFSVCHTISFFPRPIYYYRLAFSGQSVSVTGIRKHYKENEKMLMGMLAYYDSLTEEWAREMVFKRLSAVCELMYRMYFALRCNRAQKSELIAFDQTLREQYPALYQSVNTRPVAILRKSKFFGYWLVAHWKMHRDRKLKMNFFEGE